MNNHSLATVVLVAVALLGCGSDAPESAPPQRLLKTPLRTTLAGDTRLASGPERLMWRRGRYASAQELPNAVALPDDFPPTPYALVNYRISHDVSQRVVSSRARAQQHSLVVPVRADAGQRNVALPELGERIARFPAQVQLSAHPLHDVPHPPLSFSLRLPEAPVLAFAYGVPEASWVGNASPVEFRVGLIDALGMRNPLFEAVVNPRVPREHHWFDVRADLAAWSGELVTLVFETGARSVGTVPSLASWANIEVRQATAATPRNVILISLDTLRARNLPTYGYARDTAPFLASVAERGTTFDYALSTASTTASAHMSLFTGLYAPNHGMLRGLQRRFDDIETLAQRLWDAGYKTAAFTENGFLLRTRGFEDGFERYVENRRWYEDSDQHRRTFEKARAWLEHPPLAPFFLFLHTYQVHSPYDFDPPEPYASLFPDSFSPPRPALDAYDREIRMVDDDLRRLFATLEERGLADDTIVVVLSDHGEEFGEHGGFGHGHTLHSELLRIPLLWWGPGLIPEGRRHAVPVSLIDVTPTLLDLLRLPIPPDLDGTSLASAILQGDAPPARPLFAETRFAPDEPGAVLGTTLLVALHRQRDKLILHRPKNGEARTALRYDLASDPREQEPLAVDPEELRAVDALVERYLVGHGREPRPSGHEELDLDLVEDLRRLGYVD